MSLKTEDTLAFIMTKKVITISANEKVSKALTLMAENDIGSLVATDKGQPVGIITERDITRRLVKNQNISKASVRDLMSQPLVTAEPDTPSWEAFRTMLKKRIRRLPIVEKGKLVGIVTERDLFRWVLLVAYEPNIPEDIREIVEKGYPR
ncbi:MAG TPA: CBS domain-containing protein [Candidatus Bathyarchaeia archaeon]